MSTKAEQCKYGCLVCGFPPVMTWGGGRGGSSGGSGSGGSGGWVGRALKIRFFLGLFLAKRSVWGELSLVMKPRLPWQVATRPLTAEDGWRAQSTQEAPVFQCDCVSLGMLVGGGGGGHSNGEMTQSSCYLFNLLILFGFFFVLIFCFLIDVVGWGACELARCCCWIQGRPDWMFPEQYGGIRLITNVDLITPRFSSLLLHPPPPAPLPRCWMIWIPYCPL